jgi:hypothetical protein
MNTRARRTFVAAFCWYRNICFIVGSSDEVRLGQHGKGGHFLFLLPTFVTYATLTEVLFYGNISTIAIILGFICVRICLLLIMKQRDND